MISETYIEGSLLEETKPLNQQHGSRAQLQRKELSRLKESVKNQSQLRVYEQTVSANMETLVEVVTNLSQELFLIKKRLSFDKKQGQFYSNDNDADGNDGNINNTLKQESAIEIATSSEALKDCPTNNGNGSLELISEYLIKKTESYLEGGENDTDDGNKEKILQLTGANQMAFQIDLQKQINQQFMIKMQELQQKTGITMSESSALKSPIASFNETSIKQSNSIVNNNPELNPIQQNKDENLECMATSKDLSKLEKKLQKSIQSKFYNLQNRLDTVQQQVFNIQGIQSQISELQKKSERNEESLEMLSRKMSSLMDRENAKDNKFKQLVDEIKTDFNKKIKAQDAFIERNLKELLENFEEHSELIEKNHQEIETNTKTLQNHGHELTSFCERIESLELIVLQEKLMDRLIKTEQTQIQNSNRIEHIEQERAFKSEFEKYDRQLKELKHKHKKMEDKIFDLELSPSKSINDDTNSSVIKPSVISNYIPANELQKELDSRMVKLKETILKFLTKKEYLAHIASHNDDTRLEDFESRVKKLEIVLNDKVDETSHKKAVTQIDARISEFMRILRQMEDNREEAMVARRNWYCLSCEKQQEDYQGRIAKHLVDSLPKQSILTRDEALGGGIKFKSKNQEGGIKFKQYESTNIVRSSSVSKMPRISKVHQNQ